MSKASYTCDNCGAELIFNGNMTFKECSYCGNLVALLDNSVIETGAKEIIPFDVTAEEAYYMYQANAAVNYSDIPNAEKVYIPFYWCKFNFFYFANCREIVSSGDNEKVIYYDVLVDGTEDSLFSCAFDDLGESNMFGTKHINKDKIKNLESLNSGDYTVLKGKFVNSEKSIDKAANTVGAYYATSKLKKNVYISSSDCAEYNKDIKIVLVPFYCFKNDRGNKYVLGQRRNVNPRETSSLYNAGVFDVSLIGVAMFFTIMFASSNLLLVILVWFVVVASLAVSKIFKDDNFLPENIKIKKIKR